MVFLKLSLAIIIVALGTLWFPLAVISCFYFVPFVCGVLERSKLMSFVFIFFTNVSFVLDFVLPKLVIENEFFGKKTNGKDMLFFAYDYGFSSFLILFLYFVLLPSQLYMLTILTI